MSSLRRHLLHVFPSFGVGGVEKRIVRIINALESKYRHTIIALDGKFEAAKALQDVDVSLEAGGLRKSPLLTIFNIRLVLATLRRIRPDVLLTYNWGTAEWGLANCFFRVCPQIHFESGFGAEETADLQLRRRILARRLFLQHCSRVVVPSQTLYDVARRVWRVSPERLLYLPNGVSNRSYDRPADAALLRVLSIPKGVPVIGTVAGLRREKNLRRLIRVFEALPAELGTYLVIAGDGPEEAELRTAAARSCRPSRIIFAGQIADSSLLLRRFDVFALTSDTEQMPNALLEAMAASRAIVATDVGDIKNIVCKENREFIVSCENETALTQAAARLLGDRLLGARLGEANRRRAESDFSLAQMIVAYDKLYSQITEDRA